jgi:uncharacterized protein (TIGR03083 family)
MHPAPPDDLHGLLDAYEQSVRAVIDLGTSCHDADFDKPTECPGWTVKDVISHVVGGEKRLAGVPTAVAEVTDRPYIHSKQGLLNEQDVEARRPLPGHVVVAELAEFLPERMEQLRAATSLDVVIGGYFGPETTLRRQLNLRIMDAWLHEQDIRAALDRPGDLDAPGAAIFTAAILRSLPRIIARTAGITPGHAVIVDVTGPLLAREGVRVWTGEDGRPFGESLFSGHDRPEGEDAPEVTTIHLTTEAITRRAAGRRSTDEITYTVVGDDDTARAVLDALVIVD